MRDLTKFRFNFCSEFFGDIDDILKYSKEVQKFQGTVKMAVPHLHTEDTIAEVKVPVMYREGMKRERVTVHRKRIVTPRGKIFNRFSTHAFKKVYFVDRELTTKMVECEVYWLDCGAKKVGVVRRVGKEQAVVFPLDKAFFKTPRGNMSYKLFGYEVTARMHPKGIEVDRILSDMWKREKFEELVTELTTQNIDSVALSREDVEQEALSKVPQKISWYFPIEILFEEDYVFPEEFESKKGFNLGLDL